MADFAIGFASTVVQGTVSRIQAAIEQEMQVKAAAVQDLVFITMEFQMIHSFLRVANKERDRNELVRTWVQQVRDTAFDVEDCIEFVSNLDNESRNWVWRLVPSCMAPPHFRDLDAAVAQLKLLKERVAEVSQRYIRYNLISDSGSIPVSSAEQPATPTTGPSTMEILMELWEANGKYCGLCNLQQLITSEGNDLQVISLWGSAGSDIEGTQIISKAYIDPEICQIFQRRAWVKLLHPFNPDEFLKNLQTQLQARSSSCQAVDFKGKTSVDDPMKQFTEQRYLIVLEGISSVAEWDFIRMYMPDNNNGSRIVVSTKQIGDAIFLTGEPYRVSVLKEFTGGHYLCAFHKKASGYYGYGNTEKDSQTTFLSNRTQVRVPLTSQLEVFDKITCSLDRCGVSSVWGIAGVGKSTLVGDLYCERMCGCSIIGKFAWVDVPDPFDLVEFSQLLFLDFHRCDLEAMEAAAIGIMQGQDPIQGCREIMRQEGYLVIIDGLRSTYDWDLIKNAFLSQPTTKSTIVVITTEESIARHSVQQQVDQMININCVEDDVAYDVFKQVHLYPSSTFGDLHCFIFLASSDGTRKLAELRYTSGLCATL